MARKYWLMKSEPDVFSYDDLVKAPKQTTSWEGVRNYQARNMLRDDLKLGDRVLFYHSNTKPPHVAGVAEVVREAYPDPSAFDKKAKYYDAKSDPAKPRWFMVDIKAVEKLPAIVSLDEMKEAKKLSAMKVVQKGMRLSVQPVTKAEFDEVLRLARRRPGGP